ncbi:MAG TPA: Fic family protein [Dermatophilaceae bacterium]|nr:Fic family protein [Dermatophilaceae bacterium]
MNADEALAGTPYLTTGTTDSQKLFDRLLERSRDIHRQAERVGQLVAREAASVFESFGLVLRSEAVAESNQMEHLEWSSQAVRDVVVNNRQLLDLPVNSFVEGVRGDEHLYEALGLYKAQMLADEWSHSENPPREFEIRQLHGLITSGHHYAGKYKTADNQIGGAKHRPPSPADAAAGMSKLAKWWESGTGEAILDATIIHAWLAHLHPFVDGNGRMARLLANLCLSRKNYPPLIVSAASDRGEYYDALAASDDGDILPLFELFVRILRRTTRMMGRPGYVEGVIKSRLLSSPGARAQLWRSLAEILTTELYKSLAERGFGIAMQGYPSPAGFTELGQRSKDGNTWFMKVLDRRGEASYLLWFGYNSEDYVEAFGKPSGVPSVFLSHRNPPGAFHPFSPAWIVQDEPDFSELVLVPGVGRPARICKQGVWYEETVPQAARSVANALAFAF